MIPVMIKMKETTKQILQDLGTVSHKIKATIKQNQNQGNKKVNPSKKIRVNNGVSKSILLVDMPAELW